MKLNQVNNLEIERVGDTEEGVKAGISKESLPFIFNILTKGFYSDPIGSIVREITSNCFDSHAEAGVSDPVVVSKTYYSEEGFCIEFKDVGVGLSQQRLVDIYMSYFSSTKRDTNDQIGGFGLGSKTPLAYQEMFYIDSYHGGKQYSCILHRGTQGPELESMYGWDYPEEEITREQYEEYKVIEQDLKSKGKKLYFEEGTETIEGTKEVRYFIQHKYPSGIDTEERNGTVIRIVIKDKDEDGKSIYDIDNFKKAIQFQLAYFDNVYLNNWGLSNDWDIFEGEYFKFRSDIVQSDTEVHIVYGKVRYPIDFRKIDLPAKYRKAPIGVKFNIGELDVVPNRESIQYSDKIILMIKERVKLAVEEVLQIFEEQSPKIDRLEEYVTMRDTKPRITFTSNNGAIIYFYMWPNSGTITKYKWKPIAHLDLPEIPPNFFFMYEIVGVINANGKRTSYSYLTADMSTILGCKCLLLSREDNRGNYDDVYITEHYGKGEEVYLIRRKKISKYDVKGKTLFNTFGLKESHNRYGPKINNKAKSILEFIKTIDKEVLKRGDKYENYKPSQEWISNYKKSLRENSPAYLRKLNKKVFVRDAGQDFKGREFSLLDLENREGIIVYGYKEDREVLRAIYTSVTKNMANLNKNFNKYGDANRSKIDKAFMVLQVAKTSEDAIKSIYVDGKHYGGPKKSVDWKTFLQTKYFRKIETAVQIYYLSQRVGTLKGIAIRRELFKDFNKDLNALTTMVSKYAANPGLFNIDPSYLSGKYIPEMMREYENFSKKHIFKVPLLDALDTSVLEENLKRLSLIDYLMSIKVRLENKCYLVPLPLSSAK